MKKILKITSAVTIVALHMNRVLAQMRKQGASFKELTPPDDLGLLCAADVRDMMGKSLSLEDYEKIGWSWGSSVWNAWKEHHAVIQSLYETYTQ
jgi:hypothetical protein